MKKCHQISLSSILLGGGDFVDDCCFFAFDFYQYYVEFLSKMSKFDVQLAIDNFCDRSIGDFEGVS